MEFLTKEVIRYEKLKSPMTELGEFVFVRTYSRWLEKRRETWLEAVVRVLMPTLKS